MPGINVTDSDGDLQTFPDATTWHIDDRGQLHLKAGDNPVATFAKDRWQGAGTADATSPAALHPDLGLEILQLLGEIKAALDPKSIGTEVARAVSHAARKGGLR